MIYLFIYFPSCMNPFLPARVNRFEKPPVSSPDHNMTSFSILKRRTGSDLTAPSNLIISSPAQEWITFRRCKKNPEASKPLYNSVCVEKRFHVKSYFRSKETMIKNFNESLICELIPVGSVCPYGQNPEIKCFLV